jgi:RNA polymerase sigma-70 factor (ECF subfamily)
LASVTHIEADVGSELAAVFREEAGGLTGALARYTGDFALAEECVQDALVRALEHWPREGIPKRPGAWLMTVARRRALDRLRRERVERSKLAAVGLAAPSRHPDDRLRAIFTCCHPALAREAQLALTLQAVCGFTTAQIAGALVSSEAAVSQRISRARRKITAAGIGLRRPEPEELDERLAEVLAVVYLMFNEGYLSSAGGAQPESRDLTEDAAWLGALLVRLYPREPEPAGLLALMRLHLARARARFDAEGELVLLADQDRSRWDVAKVAAGRDALARALALHGRGPYVIQAAIASLHTDEPRDWRQIAALYAELGHLTGSPVVELNRAIAVAEYAGPEAGLEIVDRLPLENFRYLHSTRADLLRRLGRTDEARDAYGRALELVEDGPERRLLDRRLAELGP